MQQKVPTKPCFQAEQAHTSLSVSLGTMCPSFHRHRTCFSSSISSLYAKFSSHPQNGMLDSGCGLECQAKEDSCHHSSLLGQELVFVLAGFHNAPVWGPLKSSPAFKPVTCSPSLMPSANGRRSTLNRQQRQVMASDEFFPLQKPLPPLLSFTSFTVTVLFLHPSAQSTSTTPQHCTIHRKYCRSYLDYQTWAIKHRIHIFIWSFWSCHLWTASSKARFTMLFSVRHTLNLNLIIIFLPFISPNQLLFQSWPISYTTLIVFYICPKHFLCINTLAEIKVYKLLPMEGTVNPLSTAITQLK